MQIKIKLNENNEKIYEKIAEKPSNNFPQKSVLDIKKTDLFPENSQALRELQELIGLDKVKELIFEIRAFAKIQRIRSENELCAEPIVMHAIFKGNPGTGKTTVARLLAKLYQEMGILQKGQMLEVERADLVGEYIGHTAQKTKEQVKRALGGVLFIDEAYSLCRGGEKDFGREAIDVLVKAMEDHKNDFVLILAGYTEEMEEFLRSNPGLSSRFPLQINFPDYSVEELMKIAVQMYHKREYQLALPSDAILRAQLEKALVHTDNSFGNARTVRNIIEASLRVQAVRLVRCNIPYTNDNLQVINEDDIRKACSIILMENEKKMPFNVINGQFRQEKQQENMYHI